MIGNLRREVLQTFKKLHRTRLNTFKGDTYALEVTRKKINEEYAKHRHITDEEAIAKLNQYAKEVEREVRTTVIQAVEVAPKRYEVRLTPDIILVDNVPPKRSSRRNQEAISDKKCINPEK